MHLEIRGTNIHFGTSVREHITRQMESAIGQNARRVGLAAVYVTDINGPQGGDDKQCRITARLHGGKTICVEDTDHDLIRVIDRAAGRIKQTLVQEVERRWNRRHQPESQEPASD